MGKNRKKFSFMKTYKTLTEVLIDHKLASLGDAYVNFAYSLALSNKKGKPSGAKVKGYVLAEALKRSGVREHLPARITRHAMADAAEALLIYAWLNNYITLEDTVAILEENDDPVEGFGQLLTAIGKALNFFKSLL